MSSMLVTLHKNESADKSHHGSDRFHNPWPSYIPTIESPFFIFKALSNLNFSMMWAKKELSAIKVRTPDFTLGQSQPRELKTTWLGHACALVEFPRPSDEATRGVRVLFDPVFSERCSPSQYAGPKRFTICPINKETPLPELDIVCLSHNHYDHLDVATLKDIYKSQASGSIRFFVPLKNAYILHEEVGIPMELITECDWWDSATVTIPSQPGKTTSEKTDLELHFLPAQHGSARGMFDRSKSLWGSWLLVHPSTSHKVYFTGDTGYKSVTCKEDEVEGTVPTCPAFKEIGEKFGPIDLALVPIGAYSPRVLFSAVHASPEEAVCIHRDIKSKKSIAIHWGTYMLTDEPVSEPPERLKRAMAAAGLPADEFIACDIGETVFASSSS